MKILALEITRVGQVNRLARFGKQSITKENQVKQSEKGDKDAHLSNLKHRKARIACLRHQSVYHQVGRRSDERAHTAQNRGIREGN